VNQSHRPSGAKLWVGGLPRTASPVKPSPGRGRTRSTGSSLRWLTVLLDGVASPRKSSAIARDSRSNQHRVGWHPTRVFSPMHALMLVMSVRTPSGTGQQAKVVHTPSNFSIVCWDTLGDAVVCGNRYKNLVGRRVSEGDEDGERGRSLTDAAVVEQLCVCARVCACEINEPFFTLHTHTHTHTLAYLFVDSS